jgi:hypothetical protein
MSLIVAPQPAKLAGPMPSLLHPFPAANGHHLMEVGEVPPGARPLTLRGGAEERESVPWCTLSVTSFFAWAGANLGFALPLAVGIENLITSPSYFNPSGERHLGLGIAMIVCSVTVFPVAGGFIGSLVGAAVSGALLCCCASEASDH